MNLAVFGTFQSLRFRQGKKLVASRHFYTWWFQKRAFSSPEHPRNHRGNETIRILASCIIFIQKSPFKSAFCPLMLAVLPVSHPFGHPIAQPVSLTGSQTSQVGTRCSAHLSPLSSSPRCVFWAFSTPELPPTVSVLLFLLVPCQRVFSHLLEHRAVIYGYM